MLRKYVRKIVDKYHKRRLMFINILSYIVIILISMVSNIFIYNKAVETTQQDIINKTDNTLDIMIDSLEWLMDMSNNYLSQINTNYNFMQILQNADKNQQDPHVKECMIKLSFDLQKQLIYNDCFKDIYIFFKNADTVVSTTYTDTSQGFFTEKYRNSAIDYNSWYERINTPCFSDFLIVDEENKRRVEILYQMPEYNDGQVEATLILLVTPEYFNTKANSFENSDYVNYIVLDDNGEIISESNKDINVSFDYAKLDSKEGVVEVKGAMIIYKTSPSNNYKFACILPQSFVNANVMYIRYMCLVYILMSVLVALMFAIFFAIKNNKPVFELFTKSKSLISDNDSRNVFDVIDTALNEYSMAKRKLKKMLYDESLNIRQMYVHTWFNQGITEDIIKKLGLISENYYVISFKLKNTGNDEQSEAEKLFIMQNVLEELCSPSGRAVVVRENDSIVMIYTPNEETIQNGCKAVIEKALMAGNEFIMEQFAFSFSAGVSTMKTDYNDISKAYTEGLCAFKFCKNSENKIIFYENYSSSSEVRIKSSIEQFYNAAPNLENAIKSGQKENAVYIFERMLDSSMKTMNPELTRIFSFNITGTLMKLIPINSNTIMQYDEMFKEINEITNLYNSEKSIYGLVPIVEKICGFYSEDMKSAKNENRDEALVKTIIGYLCENYFMNDLNIAKIGEVFGLSPYYISKLFKKATGEPLLDYIQKIRIKNAKKLLVETDMPIEQLGQKVGFSNMTSFVRIFTKYEALTPRKYRMNNQKN